ncbi:MAG: hypothetical protein FD181_2871 [Prolixibacteraceae bacterium]|nr:MAG: hypothetical protein FD181_2871 [Prolixibacteraceae bacterium]
MATFVFRHKVGDFKRWIKGHQDRVDLFGDTVSGFKTFQDADDPKSIVIVMEVNDIERLGAIINDPKNQAVKDRHTVLEPITMSVQVDV